MATSSAQEGGDEGTDVAYTEWIDVQKKTFTNWVNEKLKGTPYKVEDLEKDLDDGVTLITLLEALANKKMHEKYNAKPQLPIHKSENLEIALGFMTEVENIKIQNIGVSDITDHNLKLILALVWALILRYQMVKRQPHTAESKVNKEPMREVTADELLLGWIKMVLPSNNIDNLTSAWNDGRNLSALVDYCEPGLIPNHASLDPKNRLENVRHAMTLAEHHLSIPQVMHPEDLVVDYPDKFSTMTYLSQFWWRSTNQLTSPQRGDGVCQNKQSPETDLPISVEELEVLKQQTKREMQKQFEEEMEQVIAKRDAEHKKQFESLKRKMEEEKQKMQEECKQVQLEKNELETELEIEKVSSQRERLKREKELESVHLELQKEKQRVHSMEAEHRRQLAKEKEVLEAELKYERLLKKQKLLKRDKEHKNELESVRKELETEKQKQAKVQREENDSLNLEMLSLQNISYVDHALRKNHHVYFRGFFLLHVSVIFNGQLAQISTNEQGWLTLRCPTTNASVTFNDLYTKVTEAVQYYNGVQITNFWCSDVPLFQLNVSSTDSLQKLLKSKSNLQKELTTHISQLFKKRTQVQLQPEVFLILPSASNGAGNIVHVTADNAAQSMAQWEGSAAFTFQDVFQQWNDHSRRNEPTLGTNSLRKLVEALEEVVEWFQFGIHLGVPHYELSIIKADHQDVKRCKTEMFQWWLNNSPETKWSTIVKALVKAGMKALAHRIALDHGVPTVDFSNLSESAKTVEPPRDMAKNSWEKVGELRASVRGKNLELAEKVEDLKVSQQERETLTHEMAEIKVRMEGTQTRIRELLQEKDAVDRELKLKEAEIVALRLINSSVVTARECEFAEHKKQLESVKQELQTEKEKMSLLQEQLQRKREELAEKSVEIRLLREARDSANSQVKMERELADMKSRELASAARSHAVHITELQMQLASLKEKKEHSDQVIHALQKMVQQKEAQIQELSQEIAAKEGKIKEQRPTPETAELHHSTVLLELEDIKMKIIELEEDTDCARSALKLAQEEASYYQEHAVTLFTTSRKSTKLALKWIDRKRAPDTMIRGATVVQGSIAYVIGHGSHTIYSYQFNGDKWKKHCECPHINPGLVIINYLLTAVGGRKGDCLTNKLISWNRTKWVETFPPMQTPRTKPAMVQYGNYVIAVGGDCEWRGVELFHIPSLLWSTVTSLPNPLEDITATLCHHHIIAMDSWGSTYMININLLISSVQKEESSTEHSQWILLPKCPVDYDSGPTLTTFGGQTVVVSPNGTFQLQERQWTRIGDMSVPMGYDIACVVRDQMVVVGGCPHGLLSLPTDAVRMAITV